MLDNVFVINLLNRPDRLLSATTQLNHFNIDFEIFPAFDYKINPAFGCYITYLNLVNHCIEMEYENVLFLEDDFYFTETPDFENILDQLPQDYHCCWLGYNPVNEFKKWYSHNLIKCEYVLSTHAIIYSRSALELIKYKKMPYDMYLSKFIQTMNKSYCYYPMLAIQLNGFSDIELRNVNYDMYFKSRYKKHIMGILNDRPVK